MLKNYFLAAICILFSFCSIASAETDLNKPVAVRAGLALVYDDNVFQCPKRILDVNPCRLPLPDTNTRSRADFIFEPSFALRFRPLSGPYAPTLSAGLSGSFYRQNATLNDHSHFIAIEQGIGLQTNLTVTYSALFLEFPPPQQTFRTIGVDAQTDFKILLASLSADFTGDDRNYGAGMSTSVPILSSETAISYQFDQYMPLDKTLGYSLHEFRVEPWFSVTEETAFNLYADIQKKGFTVETGDNAKRSDLTWGLGLLVDYTMSEKISAQLGYDHTRWRTNKTIPNTPDAYNKNTIMMKVSVSL